MNYIKEIKKKPKYIHILFVEHYTPNIPDLHQHNATNYCIKIENPEDYREEFKSEFIGIIFADAIEVGSRSSSLSAPSSPSYLKKYEYVGGLPVKS